MEQLNELFWIALTAVSAALIAWALADTRALKRSVREARAKAAMRKPRLIRISVHLPNGHVVTHYAGSRTYRTDGSVALFDGPNGTGGVVADYAPGRWQSLSVGKRSLSLPSIRFNPEK